MIPPAQTRYSKKTYPPNNTQAVRINCHDERMYLASSPRIAKKSIIFTPLQNIKITTTNRGGRYTHSFLYMMYSSIALYFLITLY